MIILIIYVQFLIVWSSINNNRSLLILRAGLKSFEEKHEGIKKSLLSLATLVTGQEQVPISYIVSWSYLLSYIILANLAIGQEQGLIFILCLILILSYPGHLGHWNRAGILIMPPQWTPVSLQSRRDNYTHHLKYKSNTITTYTTTVNITTTITSQTILTTIISSSPPQPHPPPTPPTPSPSPPLPPPKPSGQDQLSQADGNRQVWSRLASV